MNGNNNIPRIINNTIIIIALILMACGDSQEFQDTMDPWNDTDYTWGGGHDYDTWNDYGLDYVLDDGIDCSGKINLGMWEMYGDQYYSHDVDMLASGTCEFFEWYDPRYTNIQEGDISYYSQWRTCRYGM